MFATTLLFALAGASAAPPPPLAAFPGGLLSPSGRVAYLGAATGLQALDLRTGAILWRSEQSHHPLFVAGDRLYALALSERNEVRVLGHDVTRRGAVVSRSAVVSLPRWAVSAPSDGHTFRYTVTRQRQELRLEWTASARATGGPAKEASGAARIDLRTGLVKAEKASAPATPAAPPRVLEKLSVRWHRLLARQVHALVREDLPAGQQRLVLRAWEERSGKPTLTRELLRGRDVVVMVGTDDRHLWLREATLSPSQPGAEVARSWAVFSGVDGRLVATVPVLPGTRQALLHDGRAYLLTSRTRRGPGGTARPSHELHAYDLETGKVVWKKALEGE